VNVATEIAETAVAHERAQSGRRKYRTGIQARRDQLYGEPRYSPLEKRKSE
jgi:hypothetical protein